MMDILATGVFEVGMLLCFAAAWPLNIIRAYRARTAVGTSIGFMTIIEVGYVLGILNKVVRDDINYVVAFYVLDIVLVGIGMALYFRNLRLDRIKASESSGQNI